MNKIFYFITILIILIMSCTLPNDKQNISTTTTTTLAFSQDIDGTDDLFFDDTKHHTINISIDEAIFQRLLDDYSEASDYDTEYRLASSFVFDGVEMRNISIRCRGNGTNEDTDKRSFKIAFDCIDPLNTASPISSNERASIPEVAKRQFYEVEELNLRASTNDPTTIRELLAYKFYREHGVPAPRASTCTIYINNSKWGVYLIVEEPTTKRFLKRWFTDTSGNLYKGAWAYDAGADFQPGSYNSERYKLQTNKTLNDTTDIQSFISGMSSIDSRDKLIAKMDISNLVNYTAISSFIGHWDSFLGNKNNDIIYHNPTDNKWYIVVWDCDNTFGSDWIGDTRDLDIDMAHSSVSNRASFCTLMSTYCRSTDYKTFVTTLISEYDGTNKFQNEVTRLKNLIKTEIQNNDKFLLSYTEFENGFNTKPGSVAFVAGELSQYSSGVGLLSYFSARLTKFKNSVSSL